jgi:DNA-binding LacI/PurR family transcriptional regulator
MNQVMTRIYRHFLEKIALGELKPGDRLPIEKKIAVSFSTTKMNAQRALNKLRDGGLIIRVKRRGTFVRDDITQEQTLALRATAKKTILVLCSTKPHQIHWDNSSFETLEHTAATYGHEVVYEKLPVTNQRVEWERLFSFLAEQAVVAVVIFPDQGDTERLLEHRDLFAGMSQKCFILNRSGESCFLPVTGMVSLDPFAEGVKVGKILARSPYPQICYISCGDYFWDKSRANGIRLGLRQEAVAEKKWEQILSGTGQYKSLCEKIAVGRGMYAVAPVNNQIAAEFMDAASARKLSAPGDYALITFDDNPSFRTYNFTTMAQPLELIGSLFVKLVCEQCWLSNHQGRITLTAPSHLIRRRTFVTFSE